jgi:hypothetical protein
MLTPSRRLARLSRWKSAGYYTRAVIVPVLPEAEREAGLSDGDASSIATEMPVRERSG